MNPTLALSICFVFVVYLLYTDKKSSYGVWFVLLWLLIIASRPVSSWLNIGVGTDSPSDYLEGNPFERNIFLLLNIIGLLICYHRRVKWSLVIHGNIVIFCLFLYYLVSISWSEYPFVSFKRYFRSIGNIFMVLIILSENNPSESIKNLIRKCSYILIPFSIVLIRYFPRLGRSYHRWSGELSVRGVCINKNGLGVLCLIVGIILIYEVYAIYKKKHDYNNTQVINVHLVLIMTIYLLTIAGSATSSTCFIVGIILMYFINYYYDKNRLKSAFKYLSIGFIVIIVLIIFGFEFMIDKYLVVAGHEDTFWGRVNLWQELIGMMGKSYLFGVGYDSFWLGNTMEVLWDKYWWRPTEAHNGYVEIYLELGITGLVLMAIVLVKTYKNISKSILINYKYGLLRITYFVIAVLYNIMESAFKGANIVYFMFLLVSIEYNITKKDKEVVNIESPRRFEIPSHVRGL